MDTIWDCLVDAVVRGLCRRMEQNALPRSFSSEVPTDTVLADDVARALYRRMKQKCDAALVHCEPSYGRRVRLDNYDSVMQVCEWMRSHNAQSEECFSTLVCNLYDVFDMLNQVCTTRDDVGTWKKWHLCLMFVSAIFASMSALLLQDKTDQFNQCAPSTLLYLEQNILSYIETFANFPCAILLLLVCLCNDMDFVKTGIESVSMGGSRMTKASTLHFEDKFPLPVFFQSGDMEEYLDSLVENGVHLFKSFVDPATDAVSCEFQPELKTTCTALECDAHVTGRPDGIIRSGEDITLYELKCSQWDNTSHVMQALLYGYLYVHGHDTVCDRLKVCVVNVMSNTIRWIRVKESWSYSAIFHGTIEHKLLSTSSVRSRKHKRRRDNMVH